jgi:hypothetical protein
MPIDPDRPELTESDILEIRRLANVEGWSYGKLSRRFSRTVGTIGRIVRWETHQHIAMPGRAEPDARKMNDQAERMLAWQKEFKKKQDEREELKPEILKPKTDPYGFK